MKAESPSVVSIMAQAAKLNRGLARMGDGVKIPPVEEWRTSTGVALSDPEYLRAFHLARQSLVNWWTKRNPRHTLGRRERKVLFHERLPFMCHVLADYALWANVGEDLRPKDWPTTTTGVARFHGLALGELSILLHRVTFRRFFQRLYPPIPSYLFIQKIDKLLMKQSLNEAFMEKKPADWLRTLEVAYKRYGVIKTGGAGIQINNSNNVEAAARDLPDEKALAQALALVAPYMPKLVAHTEVPVAEEEEPAAPRDSEPALESGEPDPAGDGET